MAKAQQSFETAFFSAYNHIISGDEKVASPKWLEAERCYVLDHNSDSLTWKADVLPDYYSDAYARFFFAGGAEITDSMNYRMFVNGEEAFQFSSYDLKKDTIIPGKRKSQLRFYSQHTTPEIAEGYFEILFPLASLQLGEAMEIKLEPLVADDFYKFWLYKKELTAKFELETLPIVRRNWEGETQVLQLQLNYFENDTAAFRIHVNGERTIVDSLHFGSNTWELSFESKKEESWYELDFYRNDSLIKYIGYELQPEKHREIYLTPEIETITDWDVNAIRNAKGYIPNFQVLKTQWGQLTEETKTAWVEALQSNRLSFNLSLSNDLVGDNNWLSYYQNLEEGKAFASKHNISGAVLQLHNPWEISNVVLPVLGNYGVKYLAIAQYDYPYTDATDLWDMPFYYWGDEEMHVLCERYKKAWKGDDLSEAVIVDFLNDFHRKYRFDKYHMSLQELDQEELRAFVREWNRIYATPQLKITSTEKFFKDFEAEYGTKLKYQQDDFLGFPQSLSYASSSQFLDNLAFSKEFEQLRNQSFLASEKPLGNYQSIQKQHFDRKLYWENQTKQQLLVDQYLFEDSLYQYSLDSLILSPISMEDTQVDSVFTLLNHGPVIADQYITIPSRWANKYRSVYSKSKKEALPSQKLKDGSLLVYIKNMAAFERMPLLLSVNETTIATDLKTEGNVLENSYLQLQFDEEKNLQQVIRQGEPGSFISDRALWGSLYFEDGIELSLWESSKTNSYWEEKGPLLSRLVRKSENAEVILTQIIEFYAWKSSFDYRVSLEYKEAAEKKEYYLNFPTLLAQPKYSYELLGNMTKLPVANPWQTHRYLMPMSELYQVTAGRGVKAMFIENHSQKQTFARYVAFAQDWLPSYGENGFLSKITSKKNPEMESYAAFTFYPSIGEKVTTSNMPIVVPGEYWEKDAVLRWNKDAMQLLFWEPDGQGNIRVLFYNSSDEETSLKLKSKGKKAILCDANWTPIKNYSSKEKHASQSYIYLLLEP